MNKFEKKTLEKNLESVGCVKLFFKDDFELELCSANIYYILYFKFNEVVFSIYNDRINLPEENSDFFNFSKAIEADILKSSSTLLNRMFKTLNFYSEGSRAEKINMNYIKGAVIKELQHRTIVTNNSDSWSIFSHHRFEKEVFTKVSKLYYQNIAPIEIFKRVLLEYEHDTKSFLGVDFF